MILSETENDYYHTNKLHNAYIHVDISKMYFKNDSFRLSKGQ